MNLIDCTFCPHECHVNRTISNTGFCGIPADIYISHIGLHFGEEPPISGMNGSGTFFFAGCNLNCVFCQNYQISQQFNLSNLRIFSTKQLADEMIKMQVIGAHNINLVSPSHMVSQIADSLIIAKGNGLSIPVIYNSNGYDSLKSLKILNGLVDIYMPDLKYLDSQLGSEFSKVDDYAQIAKTALTEMFEQVGHLEMDKNGIARSGLLVRHLVLPNHIQNSKNCLKFIAELSRYTYVSLMAQYSPQFKAARFPKINRHLLLREYDEIKKYAIELRLENLFIQELESQDLYLPDFNKDKPFNP